MEQIFPDMGFPDAERACGTGIRHAERNFFARQHWLFDRPAPQPVAGRRHLPKRCFGSGCARPVATLKGAGCPHRTPALMAGIDAVPCASAARRPAGSLLAWNKFFPTWVPRRRAGIRYGPPARQADALSVDSGSLGCFKGAGEPHRTPALFAGIDAVPCASAARSPGVETPIRKYGCGMSQVRARPPLFRRGGA